MTNNEDPDLSIEHLNHLVSTMRDWSMKQPWTKAQTAAWRLHWFGQTPETDRDRRERRLIERFERERNGDYDWQHEHEHEPFTDWPNGQGTYD